MDASKAKEFIKSAEILIANGFEFVEIERDFVGLHKELKIIKICFVNYFDDNKFLAYQIDGIVDLLEMAGMFYSLFDKIKKIPIRIGLKMNYGNSNCIKKCKKDCDEIVELIKKALTLKIR